MHKICRMPSDLVSKRDAADILGVHLSTVNRMVSDGRLTPAQQIGGAHRVAMYLFRRRDVERLAAKRAKDVAA